MMSYFRVVRMFSLSAAALFAVSSANAQVIYSTSFSADEGYSNGTLVDQPAGADDVWTGASETDGTDSYVVEDGQLVVTQTGVGSQWVYINFSVQSDGTLIVTWDWQYVGPADGVVDFGFCISDSANFELIDGNPDATWNEQGAMVRMNENPSVDVRNGDWEGGGSYSAAAEYNYQDGAWISMRYEIEVFELTLDVFAQKDGEDEVQLADDYGFRRIPSVDTDGVNSITMWVNGGTADNQIIVDNIVVAGPAPVTEWALH